MKIHIIWEIFFGNEILVYINNQYEKKFIIIMRHHIRESQPASQPAQHTIHIISYQSI